MLRKGKNSEKKKKVGGMDTTHPGFYPFFFFSWKKVPMKVILRPWSWGPLEACVPPRASLWGCSLNCLLQQGSHLTVRAGSQ